MNETETKSECIYHARHTLCTSSIRLFRMLPEESQKMLVSHAVLSRKEKGSVIVQEGQPITSILIVRKGRIKTSRIDAEGEEHVLDVLHDGQAIWHGMFLEDHTYHYTVTCLTDVELCQISRQEFEKVLAKHPETAMYLITMLSTELDEAEEKALLLGIRNPKKRLAGFLLDRELRCTGNEIHLKLEDIAAWIGLRPETVSRSLSALEKEGMIRRKGQGRIQVANRTALQKYYDEA